MDNRANQLNPNNNAYWSSRGHSSRPENWEELTGTRKKTKSDVSKSDVSSGPSITLSEIFTVIETAIQVGSFVYDMFQKYRVVEEKEDGKEEQRQDQTKKNYN